jgi:hypothetical protein
MKIEVRLTIPLSATELPMMRKHCFLKDDVVLAASSSASAIDKTPTSRNCFCHDS